MSKNSFDLPAITPLSGSRYNTLRKTVTGRKIEGPFRKRMRATKLVSMLTSPMMAIEEVKNRNKVEAYNFEEAPVFILGHWRSGTTHLHNLMCRDKQFGYVTTYQGVFPNFLLSFQWLFKSTMGMMMPKKRATDNVELAVDFPQEEEFAIGNMSPHSFYNFWSFPQNTIEYCDKYLKFDTISDAEFVEWKKTYLKLAKKAMLNTGGKRFISKNPPHTSRVKELLQIFPNAKFVYIYRNPFTVFESTLNFFMGTIPSLKFQKISEDEMKRNILHVYKEVIGKYEAEKSMIPEGNLIELSFEELEADNMATLEKVYKRLGLSDFEKAKPEFEAYIGKQKNYKKNAYQYKQETLDLVKEHWGFALDLYGYTTDSNAQL
ncbi:sulfotransferase family protein (plasmid) [Fulvitalea axinellae]|uniref:Sulfotransferase family protein n=1 Tax=Fulvitalea axinellae TaxID=1182444 RepID=A0AAU9DHY6_9BACT|nr:sulfotransferase family protein [Fulvitalea axinellae]